MAQPLRVAEFPLPCHPIRQWQAPQPATHTGNKVNSLSGSFISRLYKKVSIYRLPFNELKIYDVLLDAITEIKDTSHIRTDHHKDLYLVTLLEGEATVEQDDQTFSLKPGHLAIMVGGRPYKLTYHQPARRLSLRIPESLFCERFIGRKSDDITAQLLNNGGLLPVVVNVFKTLVADHQSLSETDQYTLTNTLLELSGSLTRASLNQDVEQRNHRQDILIRRLLNYMEQHFSDCELTPEKVAAANGISTRYLHRLFQQSDMAVSRWIWDRRLKATREDLLDPAKTQLGISEIAFARGFNDPAHFSRSFKEKFGLAPSKLRLKAQRS